MVHFVIAWISSLLSPFVVCFFAVDLISRLFPAEKYRYTELALRVIAVIFSLALPGGIMVTFGYLWFSTSLIFLLVGLVFFGIALLIQNQDEAFVVTTIVIFLMIQLSL